MTISDFRFPTSDFPQPTADCGSRLPDRGWAKIQNPKAKIQNSSRRGASILEVLFAILVTTVGLLGAVAIFPVASAQARKSRIADATAAAGRSAVNMVETRGMHRPDQWMGWNASASPPQFTHVPLGGISDARLGTPLESWASYCIDPRFIAANDSALSTDTDRLNASSFPHGVAASVIAGTPTMRRATLWSGRSNAMGVHLPMDRVHADSIFLFDDDLLVNRFASTPTGDPIEYDRSENSRPAAQAFYRLDHDSDLTTPAIPLKRNSQGHLSWMATLVPKHERFLDPGFPVVPSTSVIPPTCYVLSIVVFHQRPAGLLLDLSSERVLGADFDEVGGVGYAGGEVLLTWAATDTPANDDTAKEMLKVRSGDWIVLAKNVSHGLAAVSLPVFSWYRITDADVEPEYHTAESHYALAVSLSGQDWEVTPGVQDYAIIVPGVVGVYEKTVRLESF